MGISLLLALAIFIAISSAAVDGEQHITHAASLKPKKLSCFVCDVLTDGENCLKMERNETRWRSKCSDGQTMCMVKRFSYSLTSAEDSSSEILSLERNCTDHCEPGCIVIRAKLFVCSACCDKSYCNWISKATMSIVPSASVITSMISVAMIAGFPG